MVPNFKIILAITAIALFSSCNKGIESEEGEPLNIIAKQFTYNGINYVAFIDATTEQTINVLQVVKVKHQSEAVQHTIKKKTSVIPFYLDYDDD